MENVDDQVQVRGYSQVPDLYLTYLLMSSSLTIKTDNGQLHDSRLLVEILILSLPPRYLDVKHTAISLPLRIIGLLTIPSSRLILDLFI